jgi:hypothetical protein
MAYQLSAASVGLSRQASNERRGLDLASGTRSTWPMLVPEVLGQAAADLYWRRPGGRGRRGGSRRPADTRSGRLDDQYGAGRRGGACMADAGCLVHRPQHWRWPLLVPYPVLRPMIRPASQPTSSSSTRAARSGSVGGSNDDGHGATVGRPVNAWSKNPFG